MDGIERYEKELEVTGKPICNASTFLNQKRCKKLLEIQEREYKEINEAKERFLSNVAKIAFRYQEIKMVTGS